MDGLSINSHMLAIIFDIQIKTTFFQTGTIQLIVRSEISAPVDFECKRFDCTYGIIPGSLLFSLYNGVARTLTKLRTSMRDYWNKQWFSSIASLFKMGTSLKGKNLPPEGANSFLKSSSLSCLWYDKSLLPHWVTSFECYYFYYARA